MPGKDQSDFRNRYQDLRAFDQGHASPRGSAEGLADPAAPRTPHNPSALFPRAGERRGHNAEPTGPPSRAVPMTPSVQELAETVPRDDYTGFVKYILAHQELIGPDSERELVSEAVKAFRMRQRRHAENCVEKSLLLRECHNRKAVLKQLTNFLKGLKQAPPRLGENFEGNHRSVLEYCERRAKELGIIDPPSQPINVPRNTAARPRHDTVEATTAGLDRMAFSSPEMTVRTGMSPSSDPNYTVKPRHVQDWNPTPWQAVPMDRRDSVTSRAKSHAKSNSFASEEGGLASVKGNDAIREIEENSVFIKKSGLKGKFKRRSRGDAKKFFRVGRVFMIFEHKELSGNARTDDGSSTQGLISRNEKLGIDIISHKTRFVVVREGSAYCWAVPITTYNGRGLLKPGLKPEDIRAHAIIYTDTRPRTVSFDEPRTTKQPIRVEPVDDTEDCELHRASRVNFAKPTTIEHNVNAVHIGWVHQDSMPFLEEYWAEQASGRGHAGGGEQASSRQQGGEGEQASSRRQGNGGEQSGGRHQASAGEQASSRHHGGGSEQVNSRQQRGGGEQASSRHHGGRRESQSSRGRHNK